MNDRSNDHMLEFRDGWRVVPDHLRPELEQIETWTMTYDQAVREVDTARMNRYLGDVQDDIVSKHFSTQRRGF